MALNLLQIPCGRIIKICNDLCNLVLCGKSEKSRRKIRTKVFWISYRESCTNFCDFVCKNSPKLSGGL